MNVMNVMNVPLHACSAHELVKNSPILTCMRGILFFPDSSKNKSAIGVKSLVASDLKYKEELVTSYLGSCLEYVTSWSFFKGNPSSLYLLNKWFKYSDFFTDCSKVTNALPEVVLLIEASPHE